MAAELQLLVLAIAIGIINLMWAAVASRRQQGLKWAGGSRDEPRPVTGVAARLERAFTNYRETFPLFAAAIVVAYLTGQTGGATLWAGSCTWPAARRMCPSTPAACAIGARSPGSSASSGSSRS